MKKLFHFNGEFSRAGLKENKRVSEELLSELQELRNQGYSVSDIQRLYFGAIDFILTCDIKDFDNLGVSL